VVTALARAGHTADPAWRDRTSGQQALLALATVMGGEGRTEDEILRLAVTAVPALGRACVDGVLRTGVGWTAATGPCERPAVRARVQAELSRSGGAGGGLEITGRAWAWAYPLSGPAGPLGYLVVTAGEEPSGGERHLLAGLAQQAGTALVGARRRARDRAAAEALQAGHAGLAATVADLQRRIAVHERLTEVAVAGAGRDGIARALHELTGLAATVEDAHGNVLARAGEFRGGPPARRRARLLRQAVAAGRPVHADGCVLAAARRRDEVLGVLVLADPQERAGEPEIAALEHAAAVLTVELARLQGIADTELRLGRDIVSDLVNGVDAGGAIERARALGHDLGPPHRVLVIEGAGDPARLLAAVRAASRDHRVGPLVLPQDGSVVVLAPDAPGVAGHWERFRTAVGAAPGIRRCRLGAGGVAQDPGDYPRSHHEALRSLRLHDTIGGSDRAICYDELGVYQLLCEVPDGEGVDRFVRRWLGELIDYDRARHAELVATLSRYLECGGNYDATADAMALGRSTVRYRLRRIRQISGHDLAAPDTRFNLQLATRALSARRTV
jgi:sugar diacid utilization regulator